MSSFEPADQKTGLPSVSIVICTDGRPEALAVTLQSLLSIEGPPFEVIVVRGPTEDGISQVLDAWEGKIKVARNGQRNLSISRNIGIASASGEVIAFLDDDAVPEAEWLLELLAAYRNPLVGCAGGFVYNPDGTTFQYRFGTVNRLGKANLDWDRPSPELCFPLSESFPHPLGANSSYRRAALIEAGGFDEEFEYYLDETDVTLRIMDNGWHIAQINGAYVHHKFMPSAIRNQERVLNSWYSVLKNRLYFGLTHGREHYSTNQIIDDFRHFIAAFAKDVDWAVESERLTEADRQRFWNEVDAAWVEGMRRGISGEQRIPPKSVWQSKTEPFLRFIQPIPANGRKCFCFLSQTYPPDGVGGVARYTYVLARAMAAEGHQVHVLTHSPSHDRIDFEDGVWVHRLAPTSADCYRAIEGVPDHLLAYSGRMRREILSIDQKRAVTAVFAPIWDCEGLALLDDIRIPLITNLVTPLNSWLKDHPEVKGASFVPSLLNQERNIILNSAGVLASSKAIVDEIETDYGISIDRSRLGFIPYGLDDWTTLPAITPPPLPAGALRLLFVGRLEPRKGIDILLEAAIQVLERHQNVHLDIVGDDRIASPDGRTYREIFRTDVRARMILPRVHFRGQTTDAELRGFYQACDFVVTPSRFESFGLMLVEGMMFGKPVIACRAGGMPEVVGDGDVGLLAEPGDKDSLVRCIEQLVEDPALRKKLGTAARVRYEITYSARRMANDIANFFSEISQRYARNSP